MIVPISKYAPIVVFAFNRLDSLQSTINSLLCNEEASLSDLFVFVDGPRTKVDGESKKVDQVKEYVKSIAGFKSLTYSFSEVNKGLGPSIIAGVTEIINKYGCAIVLEDDLMFSPNFLSYMNQGLEKYKEENKVFSICGYSNLVKCPKDYHSDFYFCTRSSSWGWATWADRWNSVDWVLEPFASYQKHASSFNKWGGSDCWKMLNEWHEGGNKSWAIRFCFAQYLQDKVSLFPLKSLVQNDGFDGAGTNCKKWSRFKCEFDTSDKKEFVWPSSVILNSQLYDEAMRYHGVMIRIWSRLMYLIYSR